jgi:hypothetical protein
MRLLREDKALLVLPLLSTVAIVVLTASFAVPLMPALGLHLGRGSTPASSFSIPRWWRSQCGVSTARMRILPMACAAPCRCCR